MSEGRNINVTIKNSKKEELEQKDAEIRRLNKILMDLAEAEFNEKKAELIEKYPEREEEIEALDVNDITTFELDMLSELKTPKKKVSVGSVRLTQTPINDIMKREWENPYEMIRYVYDNANDPTSPHYNEMKRVKKELRAKFNLDNFPKTTKMFSDRLEEEATKDLGKNFGYEDYTRWVQERAKQEGNRK